ncbi:MAG: tetratricopeptide repeat protein [Bryobacteraceae bacterium]
MLGFNFYQQGKSREAETLFRGLVAIQPNLYYGFAGLGAIALAEERFDEARLCLSLAEALEARDASVHANLGEVLLRQGKFDEAAAQFQRALDLDPGQRDPGANRARALLGGLALLMSEESGR